MCYNIGVVNSHIHQYKVTHATQIKQIVTYNVLISIYLHRSSIKAVASRLYNQVKYFQAPMKLLLPSYRVIIMIMTHIMLVYAGRLGPVFPLFYGKSFSFFQMISFSLFSFKHKEKAVGEKMD